MKNNEKGITLIEVIIVIALIGLIGSVVGSMFFTGIRSYNTADEQVESYSSGRGAFLNIERQIKRSEEIFIKDGTVYIQDMETPSLYNYYSLFNGKIMKHKVNKSSLTQIPSGSTSQIADNIKSFKLEPASESEHPIKNVFKLEIISEVKNKKLQLQSDIRVGSPVIDK